MLLNKEEFMKKIILTILVSFLSLSAFAERYVMVTHGEGKDPFWPVVEKAGADAAAQTWVLILNISSIHQEIGSDMAKLNCRLLLLLNLTVWSFLCQILTH
jgi:hypothetical protein